MPSVPLPEMTLPAPGAVPPITLLDAPWMNTPSCDVGLCAGAAGIGPDLVPLDHGFRWRPRRARCRSGRCPRSRCPRRRRSRRSGCSARSRSGRRSPRLPRAAVPEASSADPVALDRVAGRVRAVRRREDIDAVLALPEIRLPAPGTVPPIRFPEAPMIVDAVQGVGEQPLPSTSVPT